MVYVTKYPLKKYQKLGLFIFVSSMLLLLLKIWHVHLQNNEAHSHASFIPMNHLKSLNQVESTYEVPKFSQLFACPACFGDKMCREIDTRTLIFHGEINNRRNSRIQWKKAVLRNERILISSPTTDEWHKFDEFVCHNASQVNPCDLSISIRKTILASDEVMLLESIQNIHQLMDSPENKILLSLCASQRLVQELKRAFDDDFDGYTSKEEQVILFTSLIMQPGYAIMKMQSKSGMTMPIPNLLGACGRSILIEGGFSQLRDFLSESFDIRAGLAVQVLQIVEDFELNVLM